MKNTPAHSIRRALSAVVRFDARENGWSVVYIQAASTRNGRPNRIKKALVLVVDARFSLGRFASIKSVRQFPRTTRHTQTRLL